MVGTDDNQQNSFKYGSTVECQKCMKVKPRSNSVRDIYVWKSYIRKTAHHLNVIEIKATKDWLIITSPGQNIEYT